MSDSRRRLPMKAEEADPYLNLESLERDSVVTIKCRHCEHKAVMSLRELVAALNAKRKSTRVRTVGQRLRCSNDECRQRDPWVRIKAAPTVAKSYPSFSFEHWEYEGIGGR